MTKKELRREAKQRLANFLKDEANRERENKKLCKEILNLAEYKKAEIVLSYIATETEADPMEITKSALVAEKKVTVPKVVGEQIEFYFLDSKIPLEKQLKKGAFNILEPTTEKKFDIESCRDQSIFIITPGLAFSKSGRRCGHGKGFYDKYFSRLKSAKIDFFAAGFCFPCQIFSDEEIETNEKDFLMDITSLQNC